MRITLTERTRKQKELEPKFIPNKYKATLGDMKYCLGVVMVGKPGVLKIPVPERWRWKHQQFKDGYRASSCPFWVDYQR